jgi:isopentenyl diphosphate isomerase/L-lactate dehydrogenase-like FMN-dependent dehydrogenase
VLEILTAELTMTMRQCGTPTLGRITKAHVASIPTIARPQG